MEASVMGFSNREERHKRTMAPWSPTVSIDFLYPRTVALWSAVKEVVGPLKGRPGLPCRTIRRYIAPDAQVRRTCAGRPTGCRFPGLGFGGEWSVRTVLVIQLL